MTALVVDNVVKRFGRTLAVDGLSFSVPEGQVFGFLGGNGAGKTTTLRMVLDIIRPTSGSISVLGSRPGRANAARHRLPARGARPLPADVGARHDHLFRPPQGHDRARRPHRRAGPARPLRPCGQRQVHGRQIVQGHGAEGPACNRGRQPPPPAAARRAFLRARPGQPAAARGRNRPGFGKRRDGDLLDPRDAACRALVRAAAAARQGPQAVRRHARRSAGDHFPPGCRWSRGTRWPTSPGSSRCKAVGNAADGWQEWDVELATGVAAGDILQSCTERSVPLRRFDERRASLHDVFLQIVGPAEPEQ